MTTDGMWEDKYNGWNMGTYSGWNIQRMEYGRINYNGWNMGG
jgi:hypothetical protein